MRRVPALFLFLAVSIQAAEVRLGPEIPLVRGIQRTAQADVKIAWASSGLMGVWRSEDRSEILGAFDGVAFSIDHQPGHQVGIPSITAGPDRFLVVWSDSEGEQTRLVARRYTRYAIPLDPFPIDITPASSTRIRIDAPGVTADGSSFVITDASGSILRLLRLDSNGAVSEILTHDARLEVVGSFPPRKTNAEWLIPYLCFQGIANPTGVMQPVFSVVILRIPFSGSGASIVATFIFDPLAVRTATTWAGNQFAFAIPDFFYRGMIVGLERPSLTRQLITQANNAVTAGIAWNGSQYVVAWPTRNDGPVFAMRVDPNGNVLDPVPFEIAPRGHWTNPSIAATDRGVIIAYSRIDPEAGDVPRAFTRTLERLSVVPRRPAVRH